MVSLDDSTMVEKDPQSSSRAFSPSTLWLSGSKYFPFLNRAKKFGETGYCPYLLASRLASYPFLTLKPHQLVEINNADMKDKYVPSEGIQSISLNQLNISQVPPLNFVGVDDCSQMTLLQFFQVIDTDLMGMLSDRCIGSLSTELMNHLTPYLLEKMAKQRPSAILQHWSVMSPPTLVQTNFLYSSVLPREENADLCCLLMPLDFGHCSRLSVASSQSLSRLFMGSERCKNLPQSFFNFPKDEKETINGPAATEDFQLQSYVKDGNSSNLFKELFSKELLQLSNDTVHAELKNLVPFRIISAMDLGCFDALPQETKTYLWKMHREYFKVANSGVFERRADHMDSNLVSSLALETTRFACNNDTTSPMNMKPKTKNMKSGDASTFSFRFGALALSPLAVIYVLI